MAGALAHGWRACAWLARLRMAGALAHGCAMSAPRPRDLSRIFLQALMIAHPWQPKCFHIFLLLAASVHVHPCSSMFIHVHPCSSMFIHVHPCSSMFIHVHQSTWPRNVLFCQPEMNDRDCFCTEKLASKPMYANLFPRRKSCCHDTSYTSWKQIATNGSWNFGGSRKGKHNRSCPNWIMLDCHISL